MILRKDTDVGGLKIAAGWCFVLKEEPNRGSKFIKKVSDRIHTLA